MRRRSARSLNSVPCPNAPTTMLGPTKPLSGDDPIDARGRKETKRWRVVNDASKHEGTPIPGYVTSQAPQDLVEEIVWTDLCGDGSSGEDLALIVRELDRFNCA